MRRKPFPPEARGGARRVQDARDRFTGVAQVYARFRPSYPETLIDWILEQARIVPGDPVADVGCGTGIATRLLAARGVDVVGLDPNQEMLDEARAAGGPPYRRAEAARTGFPDASVALVTVAQAAHWLELDAVLPEFGRILRPGGAVAAIYNLRAESTFLEQYEMLIRRFSSEPTAVRSWETTLAALESHALVLEARRFEVPHAQRLDAAGLLGRAWSSSYVFRGVSDRVGFETALRQLHARHARDGVVLFPYRAVALVVRLRPAA